jgi:hypothetical protein
MSARASPRFGKDFEMRKARIAFSLTLVGCPMLLRQSAADGGATLAKVGETLS